MIDLLLGNGDENCFLAIWLAGIASHVRKGTRLQLFSDTRQAKTIEGALCDENGLRRGKYLPRFLSQGIEQKKKSQ